MTTLNSVPSGLLSTVDATGTLNIQTNSVNALAIDTNQNATMNYVSAQNTFGFKNRIINGAMVIDQRNAGASVTPANADYTLDRWRTYVTQSSKFTVQQNAGSVTPPSGYKNYLGVTSSSSYAITSTDLFGISQPIEGLNTYDLAWGTANAKTVTLSFWVQSSLTGTFGGALINSAFNRSYPFSYSIPVANTWTQISITIAGDTTGTWLTTNGVGIRVFFGLGVGSTLSGTAGAWAGVEYESAIGATSVVGTNGATFYITGVQLEKGSIATPFEYRQYQQELALCQRYFQINGATGGNLVVAVGQAYGAGTAVASYILPVVMRSTPSLTIPAGANWTFLNANFSSGSGGTIAIGNSAQFGIVNFNLSGGSGLTAGYASTLVISYHGFLLSAEL